MQNDPNAVLVREVSSRLPIRTIFISQYDLLSSIDFLDNNVVEGVHFEIITRTDEAPLKINSNSEMLKYFIAHVKNKTEFKFVEFKNSIELDYILYFSSAKYLVIQPKIIDCEHVNLSSLNQLHTLYIHKENPRYSLPSSLKNIEVTKPDINFINAISTDKLEYLHIIQPHKNLDLISSLHRFAKINSLTLSYCPKLRTVHYEPWMQSVVYLELDTCRNIESYDFLEYFENLVVLKIFTCPPLQDLNFVKRLTKLKYLNIYGQNVLSGDLTPASRLDNFIFSAKKHFNMRPGNNILKEDSSKNYVENDNLDNAYFRVEAGNVSV